MAARRTRTCRPTGERVTWKSLLALGVSGGLLPCPEALMVLLITIAAHRVLFGLLLIVSFSTGLAAVLVGFGLLLVYARGFFGRINLSSGLAPAPAAGRQRAGHRDRRRRHHRSSAAAGAVASRCCMPDHARR